MKLYAAIAVVFIPPVFMVEAGYTGLGLIWWVAALAFFLRLPDETWKE